MLQHVQSLPHGILNMPVAQAAAYQAAVLQTIARLQHGGGAVHQVVTIRRPSSGPLGYTPPPSGGGGYNMYNQPSAPSGGGGGGGFSFPSLPKMPGGGSGSGGGAEGTGQPAPTPIDPSTGLPSNVAPSVDNSAPIDTSGVGTTDSSGVTYGGEFG